MELSVEVALAVARANRQPSAPLNNMLACSSAWGIEIPAQTSNRGFGPMKKNGLGAVTGQEREGTGLFEGVDFWTLGDFGVGFGLAMALLSQSAPWLEGLQCSRTGGSRSLGQGALLSKSKGYLPLCFER